MTGRLGRAPAPIRKDSVLSLALRVLRGEMTEEQAIEILRRAESQSEGGDLPDA